MLPTPDPSQYRGSPVVSHVCSSPQHIPSLCKAAGVPHSSTGKVEQGSCTPKKARHFSGMPGAWLQTLKPLTGRLSLPLQHNIPQLSLLCGFLPRSVPPSLYVTSFHESLSPFKVAHPCQDRPFPWLWDSSPSFLFPKMPNTFPRQIRVGFGR